MTGKIVVKFGGSNLKELESLERLIEVVKQYEKPPVIVVSAFFGVTNLLIEILNNVLSDQEKVKQSIEYIEQRKYKTLDYYIKDYEALANAKIGVKKLIKELEKYLYGINYIGEVPDFLYDKILSYGERLSSYTINAVFLSKGLNSKEVLPEQFGLKTSGELGNASIDFEACNPDAHTFFKEEQLCIIPGFYGISPDEKVTLLGRGGTDYAAASVARIIKADSLDIWKDVDGFMSSDPKFVDSPVRIQHLSYSEAAELAYFGAKILHPRTVEPLYDVNIPVRIFNIEALDGNMHPLTLIDANTSETDGVIKSVTSSDEFALLKLNGPGVGIKPGILANITTKLNDEGININSVITSQIAINFLLSVNDLKKSAHAIKSLNLPSVQEIIPVDGISVIAVVGQGILEKPGIGGRIFNAVAANNINVQMSTMGGSNVVCYLIVDKAHKQIAISAIHKEFFTKRAKNELR
jgi:aspartate kinase/aspartokinase/homoserine dehydrogenase 1